MWWFSTPTSEAMGLQAQNRLLEYYVTSPFEVKSAAALNYIVVKGTNHDEIRPLDDKEKVLVLMHGFGLGLGFFYENFDTLGSHFDRIIAVDWPGMGCSSRTATKFTPSVCGRDSEKEKQVAQAVTDELIDSLEKLRIDLNIPYFTLAGHSLGGYLAGKYAVKYPAAVTNLVLISPVGIPHPPPVEVQVPVKDMDWKIRLLEQLWRWNYTPQGIVRFLRSRGPKLVKDHVNRRFGNRWQGEQLDLISDYLYHITAAPGSGEYVLNALLEPVFQKPAEEVDSPAGAPKPRPRIGVFAKLPLDKELEQLKVPILLVYGDHDWLHYATAGESVRNWQQAGVPAAQLAIVSNAGHHLYLDNSKDFNNAVIQWVKNTSHLAKN